MNPFLEWNAGWDPEGKGPTIVVHGHSVCATGRFEDGFDLLRAADRTLSQRRINLDIGAVHFGQLAALEVENGKYRFHLIQEAPRYLP